MSNVTLFLLPALAAAAVIALPLLLRRDDVVPGRLRLQAVAVTMLGGLLLLALTLALSPNTRTAERLAVAEQDEAAAMALLADDIEARLQAGEGDEEAEGWFLLGRARSAAGQFEAAIDAYATANQGSLQQNPDWLVTEAEARLNFAGEGDNGRRARQLLDRALALDPGHAGASFYRGLLALADGDAGRGERLLRQAIDSGALDPRVVAMLRQRLAEASADGDLAAASPTEAPPPDADSDFLLRVEAPEGTSADGEGALFVFARVAGGQGMPFAATRVAAPRFPVTVRLGDADRLGDGPAFDDVEALTISARWSSTGSAPGAAGDPGASIGWQKGESRSLTLQLR